MRKVRLTALTLLVDCMLLLQPAQAAEHVALVTDMTGAGIIGRSGEERPCEILSRVFPGDRISLRDGARVSLAYFGTGREFIIEGRATVAVEAGGVAIGPGVEVGVRIIWLADELSLLSSLAEAPIPGRSRWTRERLQALRPEANARLSDRVLFAALLERQGFHEDARREWRALSALRPEDSALKARAGL